MASVDWKKKHNYRGGPVYRYDSGRVSVSWQDTRGYWAVRLDRKIVSRHESPEKALRRGREVLANPRAWEGKKAS